eukprot:TRINITY_DN23563_c0_g1_i2.p3 TRINITY_DN23563_c0_g1~~TRINITY_DN23563_c0_g1_i2.p3  ORF type:complete len:105 (+),score=30.29 TRINITY_DN23563_c0_g1_i2:128-442(+)
MCIRDRYQRRVHGMAYFVESYYDEAMDDFSEVLENDSKNSKAYYYRGMLYGIKKDYDNALKDFVASLEIDPFNSKIWYGRAKICLLYTSPSPRDLSTSRMPSSA